MCGIAGIVGFDSDWVKSRTSTLLQVMKHRGPDAQSFYEKDQTFLFHNRLSIIDLSEEANQPMHSNCGRYIIVFNGEIYNYKALAEKLKNTGIQLRTQSDTEVILELFRVYGKDCLQMLDGMFAFAIYDKQSEKMIIARDRIGIKPLFVYCHEGKLAFSSELKFLSQLLKGNLHLNYNAVGQYLHLGFIAEDRTIFNQIRKVSPGTFIEFEQGKISRSVYWSIQEQIASVTVKNMAQAREELDARLKHSIKGHLTSDVPVGIFLSGGIDSSLVTAYASEFNPDVQTFSIGTTDARFNETGYARQIAEHLKLRHHELVVSQSDVISNIDQALAVQDEPFADSSIIPTYILSKFARQSVKVCLAGDGGDELFGGYGMYRWADRLHNPFFWKNRRFLSWVLRKFKGERYRKASAMFDVSPQDFIPTHIFSQEQGFFNMAEITGLLRFEPWMHELMQQYEDLNEVRKLSGHEKQAVFDLMNYLPHDLLVKVDRASMANSLEVRVPYLEHHVVEFALNLDHRLKIRNNEQKVLLRRILFDKLPKEWLDRPKQGFSIPLHKWLNDELSYLIDEFLDPQLVKQFDVVDARKTEDLVNRYKKGDTYLYNRIWSLIVLHRWLKQNA